VTYVVVSGMILNQNMVREVLGVIMGRLGSTSLSTQPLYEELINLEGEKDITYKVKLEVVKTQ
jgi:hypothetical protein